MKLSKETMVQLGFKEKWPQGNPTEPWWVNKSLGMTFYSLPTTRELLDQLRDLWQRETREKIQGELRRVIGVDTVECEGRDIKL